MENLDDFMKKKFLDDPDGGRFEFKEEYWQQAEALIAADEKRRRRRFWWWIGCSLLLAGLAAGLWSYEGRQETRASAAGRDAAADPAAVSENPVSAARPDSFKILEKNTPRPGDNPAAAPAPKQPENRISFSEKIKTPPASAQTSKIARGTNHRSARKPSLSARMRSTPDQTAGSPAANPSAGSPAAAMESLIQNALQTPVDPPAPAQADKPGASGRARPPALLPRVDRPLIPPPLPNPPKSISPAVPVAESAPAAGRNGRFGLAFAAFGSGYTPAGSAGSFGLGAGLSARYRLGASFAVQAGAQWRMRILDAASPVWAPQNVQNLRYGFGFESDRYELEGRAMHWLEIPLALQWRRGPWRVEAGVAPGFLLGVQGSLIHTRQTSLTPPEETRQVVRLDTEPFYPGYFAVFAGGQYALTRRLDLSLRLHYLGRDFRKAADDYEPSQRTLWADLGLRYNLIDD